MTKTFRLLLFPCLLLILLFCVTAPAGADETNPNAYALTVTYSLSEDETQVNYAISLQRRAGEDVIGLLNCELDFSDCGLVFNPTDSWGRQEIQVDEVAAADYTEGQTGPVISLSRNALQEPWQHSQYSPLIARLTFDIPDDSLDTYEIDNAGNVRLVAGSGVSTPSYKEEAPLTWNQPYHLVANPNDYTLTLTYIPAPQGKVTYTLSLRQTAGADDIGLFHYLLDFNATGLVFEAEQSSSLLTDTADPLDIRRFPAYVDEDGNNVPELICISRDSLVAGWSPGLMRDVELARLTFSLPEDADYDIDLASLVTVYESDSAITNSEGYYNTASVEFIVQGLSPLEYRIDSVIAAAGAAKVTLSRSYTPDPGLEQTLVLAAYNASGRMLSVSVNPAGDIDWQDNSAVLTLARAARAARVKCFAVASPTSFIPQAPAALWPLSDAP